MTDEQRVYIRGIEGRGDEVIKTLTDLGGKKPPFDIGGDPSYIYYITHDGNITGALYDSEVGKIIMDFYHEVKLPEQWKDGDILIDATCKRHFCVFRGYSEDSPDKFSAYISLESLIMLRDDKPLLVKEQYRLVAPSEKIRFHELLHKLGKDWDAEKKQLVSWRWKPCYGDRFYCINDYGRIESYLWDGRTDFQQDLLSYGNVFQYEYEAKAMLEKFKELLGSETKNV